MKKELKKNSWIFLERLFWKVFLSFTLVFSTLIFILKSSSHVFVLWLGSCVVGVNFALLSFLCSVYTKQRKASSYAFSLAIVGKTLLWIALCASAFLLPSSYALSFILAFLSLLFSLFFVSFHYSRLSSD